MYDTIIVGGGIAGLTAAEHCAKKNIQVLLLERYKHVGGRIVTNHDPYQYEIGAGRILRTHTLVKKLVDRFGLKTYPISANTNEFHALFDPIIHILQTIPAADLAMHTLAEIIPEELHPILRMYPYYAEMHILRADLALPLFTKGNAMSNEAEFYGIQGGLDQLTNAIQQALTNTTASIQTRHRVEDIRKRQDGVFEITGSSGKKAEAKPFLFTCKRLIVATEYRTFRNFTIFKHAQFLKHLTDSPLIRIYAVYPTKENQPAWFHDVPKTVTDSPLRHVIPIDAKKGLIMISYTDGEDTHIWQNKDDDELKAAIQSEARNLFPDRQIPEPIYITKHVWPQGCTYWKKGNYDMNQILLEAQNPLPNVYICGESVNKHQSWVESALESVELVKEKI